MVPAKPGPIQEIYQREGRRVFATLVRLLGSFDLAEDALHNAFVAAAERWPREGMPKNPVAWLVSAGRFKAIDQLRRQRRMTPWNAAAEQIDAALATRITAHPDLTLAALQAWLLDEHAVRLSNGAMWSAVARLGLSFKKRRSMPLSKIVPTSRPGAASGARRSLLSMPTSSSSSTRPAPVPR
jgi:DNA-directed RNA polymerase specialized sigma24 family protein